jgi:para-aminobenzoate synthetase/4-amino-4-deoxychorismate lyase
MAFSKFYESLSAEHIGAPSSKEGRPTSMRNDSQWHPLPEDFRRIASKVETAILLETALQDRGGERSLLFLDPVQTIVAHHREDLDAALAAIDSYSSAGYFVAGYFGYECGEAFLGFSADDVGKPTQAFPMAWLGVYPTPVQFEHRSGTVYGSLPSCPPAGDSILPDEVVRLDGLRISKEIYESKIACIHEYLKAGDTYQVNFTDRIDGALEVEPLTAYNTLLKRQPVPFAAFLNLRPGPILSFSPELFYRIAEGRITVRPMKGTWPRGSTPELDRKAEQELRNDEKNRSEHVMIVDLMRNDIGKVCEMGTVRVESIFDVERYATLLQMTATVSGQIRGELTPTTIFRNLFPSGSITGAPKHRTMEIIRELEAEPRGVYTGSIGYFAPDGTACFNVAIRTLSLMGERFVMGVGGGITVGSLAEEEFRECEMKAAFLTGAERHASFREPGSSVF